MQTNYFTALQDQKEAILQIEAIMKTANMEEGSDRILSPLNFTLDEELICITEDSIVVSTINSDEEYEDVRTNPI